MARLALALVLVVAVLGGTNGYEFGHAKRYVSSIIDKASSFVGKQKQADTSTPYYYPEEATTPIACQEDGAYPLPSNCGYYIRCTGGEHTVVQCEGGMHFSTETMQCEEPCRARCDPMIACYCRWDTCQMSESSTTEEPATDIPGKYNRTPTRFTCYQNGQYPKPSDCNKYISCYYGVPIVMSCPSGMHFNKETEKCESPCDAKCDSNLPCNRNVMQAIDSLSNSRATEETTDTPDFEPIFAEISKESYKQKAKFSCPQDGLYSDPSDCSKFIQCYGRQTYSHRCPAGLHFSSETKRCEIPCVAQCDSTISCKWRSFKKSYMKQSSEPFACDEEGLYYDPGDCSTYMRCSGGQGSIEKCPEGLHFSEQTHTCEAPCDALCEPSLAAECGWESSVTQKVYSATKPPLIPLDPFDFMSPQEDFTCDEDGHFPNPNSCSSYTRCLNGQKHDVSCPEGMHFCKEHLMCMPPCEAHCDSSIAQLCGWELKDYAPRKPEYDFACVQDGVYSSPNGCNSFVECFNGEAHIVYCPSGLQFSEDRLACVEPCEAQCDLAFADVCAWDKSLKNDKATDASSSYDMSSSTDSPWLADGFTCTRNGLYKNPEDCASYIMCSHGHSYAIPCPFGLHFSEQFQTCVNPRDSQCNPDDSTNSSHVDCEAEPDAGPCASGFTRYYYDSESGRCRAFQYGGCEGNSNNFYSDEECREKCQQKMLGEFRCPSYTGKYGHYLDCMRYYDCKKGTPTLRKCPKGTAFDHKKSRCVSEHRATCIYECRDPDTVYPYVEDCHKYIDCVNGGSKVEKCPAGTAFDPESKNCVDEQTVSSCWN